MKAFRSAALAVALLCVPLPLAGCASMSGGPLLSGKTAITASQSLLVAEAGYKGARLTMEAAVDSGLLKGANASKAKDINRKAYAALNAARAAKAAGDARGLDMQTAAAFSLIAELQKLASPGAAQ